MGIEILLDVTRYPKLGQIRCNFGHFKNKIIRVIIEKFVKKLNTYTHTYHIMYIDINEYVKKLINKLND